MAPDQTRPNQSAGELTIRPSTAILKRLDAWRPGLSAARVRAGILERCGYLFIALSMMWPATFHLADKFVGWRDGNYYMWLSWRVGDLIRAGDIFSLRIPDVVFPFGVDLRLADGLLPTFVGGLFNVFFRPVLAYNLALIFATFLNLWAGRRLAKAFSEDRFVWFIVAAGFALAPAIALRMFVHFTMYFAFAAPLLIEEAIRVGRGERSINPLKLALLLIVAYLSSIYYFLFGGLAFVIIVLIGRVGVPGFLRTLVRLLVAGAVTTLLMLPFLLPRLALDRAETAAGGQPVLLRDSFRAGADGLSLIAQPQGTSIELPGAERLRRNFRDDNVHESTIFPGFLLLLGLGGVLFLRTRSRLSLTVTAATLWLLALGTSLKIDGNFGFTYSNGDPVPWLPYTALLKSPALGSLRAANRVSFVLAAIFAAGLALSLGCLFRRFNALWQRALMTLICLALLSTSLLVPVPRTGLEVTAETQTALEEVNERAIEGESVLLVPADCTGDTLWTIKLQIFHRSPVIGCQASPSSIPWYSELDLYAHSAELAGLRCTQKRILRRTTPFIGEETFEPKDVDVLYEDMGARFLIVDKQTLSKASCTRTRPIIGELSGYETLGEDDRWLILDTRP